MGFEDAAPHAVRNVSNKSPNSVRHHGYGCDDDSELQQRKVLNSVSSSGMDSPDDLVSFEVIPNVESLSNHCASDPTVDTQLSEASEDKPKLKNKLVSAWNNVKYRGWSVKSRPRLSKTSPVCLLGQTYPLSSAGERQHFRQAFSSLLWLTYRKGFVPLGGSSLTSDCGWGCMLRTAQMLLARALLMHFMPEDWVWPGAHHQTKDDLEVLGPRRRMLGLALPRRAGSGARRRQSEGAALEMDEVTNERTHRRLVGWFGDTHTAPFSLHRMVDLGRDSGKRAGDWYGPSIAAHILRKAVAASEVDNLAMYVAQDCTVYVGDVMKLYEESQSEISTKPTSVIILVPVRLGGDSLNLAYVECVKKLLQLQCCIGVMGGKPKHSLYFVGFQDDHLIYLDPHTCQPVVDVSQENFPLESFHCKAARKMSFHRMDPSCTLGFYTKSRAHFSTLRADITEALTSPTVKYPIFTFVEGCRQDDGVMGELTSEPPVHLPAKVKRKRRAKQKNMDDFVLL